MALTVTQAQDDFETYSAYTTAANAELFVKACARLIVSGQNLSIGGKSYGREELTELMERARQFVQRANTSRPPLFSRGVITGIGR